MGSDKKLIFSAYANIHNVATGENISNDNDRCDIYFKNLAVALTSAKACNPECDVALVTNQIVPEGYSSWFERHGIKVLECPFDAFRFADNYPWALAYYKLCAYRYVLELEYEDYLMIDADVFVQANLSMLWNWTKDYLVILDTEETTQRWQNEMHVFLGNEVYVTHWGGEFVAGSKKILQQMLARCEAVFDRMSAEDFVTTHGDEFVWSVAMQQEGLAVKHAGMFVYRFWTRTSYRVKTVPREGGAVCVIHVPAEKEHGMLSLYRYMQRTGKLPGKRKAQRMLHIRRPAFAVRVKIGLLRLKAMLGKG